MTKLFLYSLFITTLFTPNLIFAVALENVPDCLEGSPKYLVGQINLTFGGVDFYYCDSDAADKNYTYKPINPKGSNGSNGAAGANGTNSSIDDYVTSNGNLISVGGTTPVTKLDISGHLQIGNSNTSCTSAMEGSVRYNSTDKVLEYCYWNGSTGAWKSLGFVPSSLVQQQLIYGGVGTLANSYGTTDTAIPQISNATAAMSGWTTTVSAANGRQITINETGFYSLQLCHQGRWDFGAQSLTVITINETSPATVTGDTLIGQSTYLVGNYDIDTASYGVNCSSVQTYLQQGDIIRPHLKNSVLAHSYRISFYIIKIY